MIDRFRGYLDALIRHVEGFTEIIRRQEVERQFGALTVTGNRLN